MKRRGAGWMKKVRSEVGGVIGCGGSWDAKVFGYSGGLKSEVI